MIESNPRDEALRTILNLDMDRAELEHLEQALRQLRSDEVLFQRLEGLQQVRDVLAAGYSSQDEPAGGPEAFQQRLIGSIERASAISAPRRPAFVGRFVSGFAGGIAAAIILFIGLVSLGWWGNMDTEGLKHADNVADHSIWLPEDPDQQRAVLTQLAGFYDGRAGWYAVTGGDVRMGLADHRVDTSEPVVTRLSLQAPDGNVISTDLVLFPGQDIVVEAPRFNGSPVRYSIKVQPPRNGTQTMMLSLTVSMEDGPSMSTQIPLAGAAVREIGRLLTDQGQYQLQLGLAGAS